MGSWLGTRKVLLAVHAANASRMAHRRVRSGSARFDPRSDTVRNWPMHLPRVSRSARLRLRETSGRNGTAQHSVRVVQESPRLVTRSADEPGISAQQKLHTSTLTVGWGKSIDPDRQRGQGRRNHGVHPSTGLSSDRRHSRARLTVLLLGHQLCDRRRVETGAHEEQPPPD